VFISSVLTNLTFALFTNGSYNANRGFHIITWLCLKKTSNVNEPGQYFTVDPVMDAFNAEKPYLLKKTSYEYIRLKRFPIRMLTVLFLLQP
jgi:hypothetical protein